MRCLLPLVALAVCVAGGCGLTKPYPEKNFYALEVPRPTSAAGNASPGAKDAGSTTTTRPAPSILQVRHVHIAKPYESSTFVYKVGPSRLTTDYYNGFIVPPELLLSGALVQHFDAGDLFDAVSDGSTSAPSRYVLETNVTSFYGDYTNKLAPRAVLDVTFFFLEDEGGDIKLLMQRTYQEAEGVSGPDAADLASAWARACGRVFDRLETDLRKLDRTQNKSPKSSLSASE